MTQDEALWNLYKEQAEQGRHLEGQRVSVMNVIVSLVTVLSAVMGIDKSLTRTDAPIAFVIGMLGACGLALASAYHDRFEHHARRMRFFRDGLSNLLFGNTTFGANNFPGTQKRIRIYVVWYILFLLIAVFGFGFSWGLWSGRIVVSGT